MPASPAEKSRNRRRAVRIAQDDLPDAPEDEIIDYAAEVARQLNAGDSTVRARRRARQSQSGGQVGGLPGPLAASSPAGIATAAQGVADVADFAPLAGGLLASGGGLTGSVLGAGLGGSVDSAADSVANNLTEETFGFPGVNDTDGGTLRGARNAAAEEFLFGKAFDATIGVGARFLRGSKGVADDVIRNMEAIGIKPSLQDMSDTGLVEGGRRILGSFPLLARPFARRQAQVTGQVKEVAEKQIADVFPDVLVLREYAEKNGVEAAARVSEAINERSFKTLDKAFRAFGERQEQAWAAFKALAGRLERSGAVASQAPDALRARAGEALELLDDARFPGGDDAASGTPDVERVRSWIAGRVEGLPEAMSVSDLRKAKNAVQSQIKIVEDATVEQKALVRLKEGIEEQIHFNAAQSPELLDAYSKANKVSEEFLTVIDDLAARRTRRMNRLVGRRLRDTVEDGTIQSVKNGGDVSETLEMIASSGKPREVRQFFEVMSEAVGEREAREVFGSVLAKRLDDGFRSALKEATEKSADDVFKPGVLLRKVGLEELVNPRAAADAKSLATVEMFKAAGMSPQKVVQLSKTIDAIFSVKNPNVSDFIRRRAVLGGTSSLLTGVTGGLVGSGAAVAAGQSAMLGPIAFVALGRGYGRLMTDPRLARWVLSAADSNSPLHVRGRAMVSLLNDADAFSDDTDPELVAIRAEALKKLRTRAGREQFFQQVDDTFDFPKRR